MKNLCVAFRDMPPDGEEVAESGWLTANTCQRYRATARSRGPRSMPGLQNPAKE